MDLLSRSLSHTFAVNEGDLEIIRSVFRHRALKKGDYFQRKGRTEERMAFVETGMLRIYDEVDGREATQWISTPGYFITDIAAFSFGVRTRWEMRALTDCSLYEVSRGDYRDLGRRIEGWNEMDRQFLAKCFAMMEDRIFGFISLSAEERYRKLFREQRDLVREVPLQYLASMLGMTPETLSRIRKNDAMLS